MACNYDRIARFYAVDMARNMPFDDVGFYARVGERRGGRVLELGCGSGRILLELLRRRIDAYGVDASAAMLAILARESAARALPLRACRMDVRSLALRPGFGVVLCPYSLITYLTGDDEAARLLADVRALLVPRGVLVVDAFVPQPVAATSAFTLDYRRAFDGGTLARWKRIVALSSERNRIERRYEHYGATGELLERVDVAEELRPYTPDALRQALLDAGFAIVETAWDYGASSSAAGARFVAFVATPEASAPN
jgi:SAM-dependent methyltransferase